MSKILLLFFNASYGYSNGLRLDQYIGYGNYMMVESEIRYAGMTKDSCSCFVLRNELSMKV
jgi:hypothetical protein